MRREEGNGWKGKVRGKERSPRKPLKTVIFTLFSNFRGSCIHPYPIWANFGK